MGRPERWLGFALDVVDGKWIGDKPILAQIIERAQELVVQDPNSYILEQVPKTSPMLHVRSTDKVFVLAIQKKVLYGRAA